MSTSERRITQARKPDLQHAAPRHVRITHFIKMICPCLYQKAHISTLKSQKKGVI